MTSRLVVAGAVVLTGPGWRPRLADVLIENESISTVTQPGELDSLAAPRHDATGRLMIPGLINAHTHSHTLVARGAARTWTLEESLLNGAWMAAERSPELTEIGTALVAAEALASGTTAVFDLFARSPVPSVEALEAAVKGHQQVGLRAVIAPMVSDRPIHPSMGLASCAVAPLTLGSGAAGAALEQTSQIVGVSREFAQSLAGQSRVHAAVAPTIVAHCSEELVSGLDALADEFGLRLHTHLAESKPQALNGASQFGSIVAELDRRGVLDERLTAAHGVWISAQDRAWLAESGAVVVTVPGSNLRLGSGVADARALLDAGVPLAMGTDGANSSDAFDALDAVRLTSLLSRVDERDSSRWLDAEEVLDAATVGGARALGMAGHGQITAGHPADLVFLDLNSSAFRPAFDLTNQLITAARACDVVDVMVGGDFVYRDRTVVGVDVPALAARFEELVLEFWERGLPLRDDAQRHASLHRAELANQRWARFYPERLLKDDLQ